MTMTETANENEPLACMKLVLEHLTRKGAEITTIGSVMAEDLDRSLTAEDWHDVVAAYRSLASDYLVIADRITAEVGPCP